MDLNIKLEELKKRCILIKLAGDMDAYTSKEFKHVVKDLIKRRKYKFIVDLEKLNYIDSIGIKTLADSYKKSRRGNGYFYLIYNKSPVKKLFSISRLDKSFTIFKSRRQSYKKLGIS